MLIMVAEERRVDGGLVVGKLRVKIMVKVGGNIFGAFLRLIFLFDGVVIVEV